MNLYIVILAFVLIFVCSCKKNSEPTVDLTSQLTGIYTASHRAVQGGFVINFITRWTILKKTNNKVILSKYAATKFEDPTGYQGPYDPYNPVEAVIDDIEIFQADRLYTNTDVEWNYKGQIHKTNVMIDATVVGDTLNVLFKEVIDDTVKEERFILIK